MASVLLVLLVVAVIALSCTGVAGDWCSKTFDSGYRSTFGEGRQAFGAIRFLAEKSVHVTLFTTLGAALWVAFGSARRQVLLALVTGFALGCCSELFQRLFPTRDPAIRDVFINCSSVALGLTLSYCVKRTVQRNVEDPVSAEDLRNGLMALSLQVGMRSQGPEKLDCNEGEIPEVISFSNVLSNDCRSLVS